MSKIECRVTRKMIENEQGREVSGVSVECGRCQHTVEVFGQGEGSVKRGLVMLREECPFGHRNWYVEE